MKFKKFRSRSRSTHHNDLRQKIKFTGISELDLSFLKIKTDVFSQIRSDILMNLKKDQD